MGPLQAIVDVEAAARAGWSPEDLARAYLDGGARFLQVRAKRLPSGAFLCLCDAIVRTAEPYRADIIVNDRADLARLSGGAGVHVGQGDLRPREARALLDAKAIVGFSTHTMPQIRDALNEPITYLAVGPVFGSVTKNTGYEAVGLELLRAARQVAPSGMPIVAIGGITLHTAPAVVEAGASLVAVIGDLLVTGNPQARVRAYLNLPPSTGVGRDRHV